MTMQSSGECPQIKLGKGGEAKPCGKRRLYRVVEYETEVGPAWSITLGTPANPSELCKNCATLDAMARNTTARIQRGMAAAKARERAPDGEEAT